jgi:two-component system phosphate regulon response regulator PhoB
MASDTTVLIVEDEPAIVELVTFSLREQAGTAATCKARARPGTSSRPSTPQLILLDWMLPDSDRPAPAVAHPLGPPVQ